MSGVGGPIGVATYMLPPMTRTADVEALERWVADDAGEPRILIAEGRVAPKSAVAWLLVAQWEKAGLVKVTTEAGGRGATCWIAERLEAPAASSPRRQSGRAAEATTSEGERVSDCILRQIRRAANFGKPAPSLKDLAAAADLRSAANADYYVQKLAERGQIRIEKQVIAGGKRRRYHILDADGVAVKRTEWGK